MHIVKEGARWVCVCTFGERDVPKAAGFRWDPGKRQWWTPDPDKAAKLSSPEEATKLMEQVAEKQMIRRELIEDSRQSDAQVELPCREGLAYLPYQRAGIASALRRRNVLFGDEMGLGKTIQAIGLINADPTIRRVLVVCPATLKRNWQIELDKWLVRKMTIVFADGKSFHPGWGDITIINYDVLSKHVAKLRSIEWDLLICDEAHLLKNQKSKRTRAICGIDDYTARKEECDVVVPVPCRRAAFLTGTPIPNRPIEGFPLFHFLDPLEFRSFYGFARRYCAADSNGYGFDPSGSSNLPELQDKLRATIMIRRLKADVLKELPAKRRQIIELAADGAAGAIEAEQEAWSRNEDRIQALQVAVELSKASDNPEDYKLAVSRLGAAAQVAFTEISKMRHETAVAKIPHVIDHLRTVTESGSKVICFAHHLDVIEAIAAEFGKECVTLYGATKMVDRQKAVERFQKDPTCLLFVGGISAAGVGITLTAASHVVFAELDWVPGNMTQCEDRAHRIGQTEMVLVQHLVLEGSLDARMANILVGKQEVLAAALDTVSITAAQEPAVPSKDRAATEGSSRSKIEALAAKLTPEHIQAIHAGLKLLAAMDGDHARQLNAIGFSRIDVQIGHSLANSPRLSPKQAALGVSLVRKYRRQVQEHAAVLDGLA